MSCTLDDTGGRDVDTMLVAASRLTTTPFEVVRFRLGRRTNPQVRSLGWSQDPTPILDQLFVFGPATETVEASDTTA